MKTDGKYALVTGATSGIGFELARLFAKDGYNLVITGRFMESLDITANELSEWKVDVITIRKDFLESNSAVELYEEVRNKGIEIEFLINDAGQVDLREAAETDINRELEIIQLNVVRIVVLTKLFLKDMLA